MISLLLWFLVVAVSARLEFVALAAVLTFLASLCVNKFIVRYWSHRENHFPELMIGFIVPLLPVLGERALLCAGLVYLAVSGIRSSSFRWALPWLWVTACWTVAQSVFGFDWQALADLTRNFGFDLYVLHRWLLVAPPDYYLSFEAWARILLLAGMYGLWQSSLERRQAVVVGLVLGLVPGLSLTLIQILGLLPSLFGNQLEFWQMQGRFSGSFSDPNAFGIFALLMLPLLFAAARSQSTRTGMTVHGLLLLALAWLACYSGSRSYLIGLGLYTMLAIWYFRPWLCGLAVLLLASLVLMLNLKPEISTWGASVLPVGLDRVLASLQWSRLGETFFSRIVFYQAAWQVFLDHWLIGSGFENFRQIFPEYALRLGLGTGTWTDNPNNYYLGILAETGLLGFLGFLMSLGALRWRYRADRCAGGAVLVLAFLLILGPHLDFSEVTVVAALLLAVTLEFDMHLPGRSWLEYLGIGVLLAVCIFLQAGSGEMGLYSWEKDPEGRMYRWTGRSAAVSLPCSKGQAELLLRVARPDFSSGPVTIRLATVHEKGMQIEAAVNGEHKLSFACHAGSEFELLTGGANRLSVRVEIAPVWIPARHGMGDDYRLLGVQLFR